MDVAGLRVAVVGGGIGGMAASLLCARAGAAVVLLERVPEVAAVGAGLLLQPNGLAVLGGLGLDEPLRSGGFLSSGVPVRSPDGTPISSLSVPDLGPGLDRVLAVRRSALHEVLLAAVGADPRIDVRLGAEVTAADGTGRVLLAGGDHVVSDLVVGADGVSSVVRQGGDFGARVRPTGAVYLRGLVPLVDDGFAGEYWTSAGLFGGAPVDATTQYFYASATAPEVRSAVEAGDLAGLRAAWAGALPEAEPVLRAVERFGDLLVNEVVRVDCARWADGRRVLLGDAAHAMAPNAGQGANSALVDAAVLPAELAAAATVEQGLAAYTHRRRRRVRRVQDTADRIARVAHWRSPAARRLRDGALRALDRPGLAARPARTLQQEDPVALRELVGSLAPR
jgi:2-polyprenyl-6-methoxyphenol hydroxylase-like FAD-dependent oxidoreductase